MVTRFGWAFIIASLYGLTVTIPTLGKVPWYGREVWFSDWRSVGPVDYATNVAPAVYYSGKPCGTLRAVALEEVKARLAKGDTLIWGVDYYALFNLSSFYFNTTFFQLYAERLNNGEVFKFKVYINKDTGTIAYQRL